MATNHCHCHINMAACCDLKPLDLGRAEYMFNLIISPGTIEYIGTDNYTAIMMVSGFMAITMFLVIGIGSADSASLADRRLWFQQCSVETGFKPLSTMVAVNATDRRAWCFTACFMRRKEMIKDGRLAKREEVCDNLVEELGHAMVRFREGRTARQLAEKCYDEANVKTEVCEIGGAMLNCLQQGMESARTV